MNTPNEEDMMDNSAYNPFPEPQTIPSGWDTSAFTVQPQVDSVRDQEDSTAG